MKLLLGTLGRWHRPIIAVLALCFLAFVGGAYVTEFRLLPYRLAFAKPFEYLRARQELKATVAKEEAKARKAAQVVGKVVTPATPDAYAGYTLLTFGNGWG